MTKYDKYEKWMLEAYRQAEKAYILDEVPVGCVIVQNDLVIGRGHNLVEKLHDSTAHAEMISITSAANFNNDWRLNNCSIYVTKEPCIMCFGAILHSRIKNLYYGIIDLNNGFKVKIKSHNLFNNHLEIIQSGILEKKCKHIIEDFFTKKRKNNKKKY